MLSTPRRKPPAPSLPTTRFIPSSPSSHYKDRPRHLSLRLKLQLFLRRPITLLTLFLAVFLTLAWALGLVGPGGERVRTGGGPRVLARDWSVGLAQREGKGGAVVLQNGTILPAMTYNETVLILCPMRNAIEHIWHFFHLLSLLSYPPHLIHLAILVSDSSDGTYQRALELADERQYSRRFRGKRFGRITVLQKDFAENEEGAYSGENVGAERHKYEAQVGRRKLLAKSRTWLLQSAVAPEADWALWLDVDLVDYEPQMIERLLGHARGEIGEGGGADVVVPNCVWKTYNEMGPYDRNNWIETPESLELKKTLNSTDVLIEGYPSHPTHRFNLASLVPPTPLSLSPLSPYFLPPSFPLSSLPSSPPLPSSLSSLTTIPSELDLDGIGGCAALVRADVHREGAVFPAWPPVDHQIETEGLAQMVKALRRPRGGARGESEEVKYGKGGRGRLLGLPTYYVYHGLYG
ncbi:hypothetical protein JCM8547_001213 [Rhodosporidiobolus lusitaniae]